MQTGIERDQGRAARFHVPVNGRGHLPFPVAQDFLNLRQEMLIDHQIRPAPVFFQRDLQPVKIAERFVHVGFFDLHIAQVHGGIALDYRGHRRPCEQPAH